MKDDENALQTQKNPLNKSQSVLVLKNSLLQVQRSLGRIESIIKLCTTFEKTRKDKVK